MFVHALQAENPLAKLAAAATYNTFALLDAGDLLMMLAAIPKYAKRSGAWYCNPAVRAMVFDAITMSAGGTDSSQFASAPVRFSRACGGVSHLGIECAHRLVVISYRQGRGGMGKGSRRDLERRLAASQRQAQRPLVSGPPVAEPVTSLLDVMQDGNEYQSILDKQLRPGTNLLDEVIRGLAEVEKIRGRPCLLYVGNVVKKDEGESSVDSSDDLPFREMVAKVPAEHRSIDVYVATRGGLAQQVSNFVNCLRARFDEVHFLIPSFCMSAGTLFALSGDHIWMTERACLGPIDPQVPTSGGRYVPAQALLLLVAEIQRAGDEARAKGLPIPWAYVRVIDGIDKKELGEALTASQYGQTMAAQFLQKYKFRRWTVRETSQVPVTEQDRAQRAAEIAAALGSHDRWKSHGHAISRDVLWSELKLLIDHPDPALNRAMTRLWAVLTFVIDKTPIVKLICSANYRYARHIQVQVLQGRPI